VSGVSVAPHRRDDVDIERDRELVERAQAGDSDAFGDLYLRYFDRLCRFCVRRLGDMSEAEDAAQEAFAKAWRALPRFDGERRFYPWLSVIAANVCTDVVRRRARSTPVDEPDLDRVTIPVDGGVEAIVDRSDTEMIGAALGRISPRHREVLRLRESCEWSYQRIADYQGVEVSTIETLLFRARRALRREFMALAEAQGALAAAVLVFFRRLARATRAHLPFKGGAASKAASGALGKAAAVPAVASAAGGAGAGAVAGGAIAAGIVATLVGAGAFTAVAVLGHSGAPVRTSASRPVPATSKGSPAAAPSLSAPKAAGPAVNTAAGGAAHKPSHVAAASHPAAGGPGAVTSTAGGLTGNPGGAGSQVGSSVGSAAGSLSKTVSSATKPLSQAAQKTVAAVKKVVKTVTNVVKKILSTLPPPPSLPLLPLPGAGGLPGVGGLLGGLLG
jgi:RNA polymerase sigma factor (sigma-70 family)